MMLGFDYADDSFRIECSVVWLFSCCLFLASWLGIWLVASRQTNAIRLSVVLLAPACLLAVKASEIYWASILVSLTVAVGYWLIHRKYLKQKSDIQHTQAVQFRFSIRSLLLCMLIVSWFLFAYLQTEYRDLIAWRSLLIISASFSLFAIGIHTVAVATHGRHIVWRVTIRLAAVLLVALAIPLAWLDDLLPAFIDYFSGWPPVAANAVSAMFGSPGGARMLWFVVGGVFYFLSLLVPSPVLWSGLRRQWKIGTALMLVCVGALPIWIVSNMMLFKTPEVANHDVNAYDELVAIGHECENSSFARALATYSEWDKVPEDQQRTLLNETEPLIAKLKQSMQKPIWIPMEYSKDDIDVAAAMALRTLCRLAIAHSTAQFSVPAQDAVGTTLLVAKMGANLQRGGLKIDSLLGIAITSHATDLIKVRITQISPKDRSRMVVDLKNWMTEIDSAEVVCERDIAWSSSANWVSHTRSVLDRLLGVRSDYWGFALAVHRHLAEWRMLIIELLLENHREQKGVYPADLAKLLADQPDLNADPFASNRQFTYRTTPDGFLLYSVGENGVDDGGDFQRRPGLSQPRDLSLASRLIGPDSIYPQ